MASSALAAAERRPATFSISRIVAAAGPGRLKAYIDEIFEPAFVALGYYTEENAETWLDIDKFMRWISRNAPKSATTPPSTSATHSSSHREHIEPSSSQSALPPSSPIPPTSSPIPQKSPPLSGRPSGPLATHASSSRKSPPSAIHISDSDEDLPATVTLPSAARKRKRKRTTGTEAVDTADSDSDCVVFPTNKKGKARKKQNTSGKPMHEVTQQFRVSEIIDVHEPRACWTVPDPDKGDDFVYRLDMTDDVRDWVDDKGEPLSMAAIIKSEDQDAWGKGSAGSLSKATKVTALAGVLCQVAKHDCQGVFICDQLDKSLLDGHERYHPDDEETRALF
ncbi:hypothetical protein DFH09DRAFT_1462238 [Mycena vulgaris]|nr:hypothetical protein DFH09DRAFT_1462238 [Mycena vulgaris]